MSKISIVLGTRPEIIKLYPIIMELQKREIDYSIIHTNQHYSENMDKVFFDQLGLPRPDVNLHVGSASHGEQTGKMLIRIEQVLKELKPDVVIVQGDTNSVLAGALAAKKLHIKVAHVEAGLRSYDERMPEEHNRIMVDHISDYLFVPTEKQQEITRKEGFDDSKVFVVGNTIVDSVMALQEKETDKLAELNISPKEYILMTIHRPENVDDRETFTKLVEQVNTLTDKIILPIHPRTQKMMDRFGLELNDNIQIMGPLNYLDTLTLMKHAKCILTDSGGIQEEACILKVPCVTLRKSTERPETIQVGAGKIADMTNLKGDIELMSQSDRNWQNPLGDGKTAERIVEELIKQ